MSSGALESGQPYVGFALLAAALLLAMLAEALIGRVYALGDWPAPSASCWSPTGSPP